MDSKDEGKQVGSPILSDSHSQVQGVIHREMDSLDDFEHLGHDSSPLKETVKEGAKDVFEGLRTTTRDMLGEIDKGVESAANAATKFADDTLEPLKKVSSDSLFDNKERESKMDSNLLEMGDGLSDKKDDKLDTFLSELAMLSTFATPPLPAEPEITPFHDELKAQLDGFKTATKNFMEFEREGMFVEPPKLSSSNDILDRYSDSDPDMDDVKPTKKEDFSKIQDIFDPFGASDPFKTETFKDIKEHVDFDVLKPTVQETPKPAVPEPEPIIPVSKPFIPEPIIEKPSEIKKEEPKPFVQEVLKEEPKPFVQEVLKEEPKPFVQEVLKEEPKPIKQEIKTEEPKPVKQEIKKEEPKPAKQPTKAKPAIIEAEAMFCKMGLDAWFNPERLNPKVESLIYWRDPKKSGPVFGGALVVLLALTYLSLITVIAYLSLLALTGTISFRIYKNIVQAVQKTGDGHPFKDMLEVDVSLPQDKVKEISEIAVAHINAGVSELRRLFLVEDLVDSIKFGVLLWCLTYLGAWFNGMTIVIIAWVALFSLPKVYEANKTQIDANLDLVRTKLADITSKVKAAIPIGKKAEEKKEQ